MRFRCWNPITVRCRFERRRLVRYFSSDSIVIARKNGRQHLTGKEDLAGHHRGTHHGCVRNCRRLARNGMPRSLAFSEIGVNYEYVVYCYPPDKITFHRSFREPLCPSCCFCIARARAVHDLSTTSERDIEVALNTREPDGKASE